MNGKEVAAVLALIAARYPTAKVFEQDPKLTQQAWTMTLDDVPYEAVQPVLARWFKTEKWAPDPAELRALIADAVQPVPSEGDVWSRRFAYFRHARGAEARAEDRFAFEVFAAIGTDCGQMPEDALRESVKWTYKRLVEAERQGRNLDIASELAVDGPEPARLRAVGS